MAELNESAEDLMPMTMELSMRRESNLEKEAENIRRFHEVCWRPLRSQSLFFWHARSNPAEAEASSCLYLICR